MKNSPNNPVHFEHLIDEIRTLTKPRLLGDFIKNSTGVFLPGFAALPAVSILSNDVWRLRMKPEPENWRCGDIMALSAVSGIPADTKLDKAFFTPVGEMTIPLIDVTNESQAGSVEQIFELRPKDHWKPVSIQFAFLPWKEDQDKMDWNSQQFISLSNSVELAAKGLEVSIGLDDEWWPVQPEWGIKSWVHRRSLDSIRFPISYATRLISPFIFNLKFGRQFQTSDGGSIDLINEPIRAKFTLDMELLYGIYRQAGLGRPNISGFSIFAHALPVMNVDLRAWLLHDSFGDFVRTAGVKPMGIAGVFPYYKQGQISEKDMQVIEETTHIFSLQVDATEQILLDYGLPGEENTADKKQLLVWMTMGSTANGTMFSYNDGYLVQPMQKSSNLLSQTSTILPLFGGIECLDRDSQDWHKKLILNYSTTPQTMLFRDSLLFILEDLLVRLGYDHVDIEGPITEIRVIGGVRRRVVVTYLHNNGAKQLMLGHLEIIRRYIADRSPLGTDFIIEEG